MSYYNENHIICFFEWVKALVNDNRHDFGIQSNYNKIMEIGGVVLIYFRFLEIGGVENVRPMVYRNISSLKKQYNLTFH